MFMENLCTESGGWPPECFISLQRFEVDKISHVIGTKEITTLEITHFSL